MIDLLIIGAGLSGAVVANKAAKKGKKVLILEKRNQIGGNVYDKKIDGVLTHMYGPHIFHTDDKEVYDFMNNFWELNNYKHIVEAKVNDLIVPLRFNFTGIDKIFPIESEEIKAKLINKYGKDSKVTILELREQDDPQLQKVADFVYENIFYNYTKKMWGKSPEEIDRSVTDRVPIVIGYNTRYFSNKYEGLPKEGYTSAITKLLDHKNIEVRTGVNAVNELELKEDAIYFEFKKVNCPIIYTGAIDELFSFKKGVLNYRSLNFSFSTIPLDQVQATAVLNDPNHPKITRTTEYKLMTLQEGIKNKTVVSTETPGKYVPDSKDFDVPYYPFADEESRSQYQKYLTLASKYKNLHMLGRLATYQYLDMDKTIKQALEKAKQILG